MADWPAYRMPVPPVLTPFHPESLGFSVPAGQISSLGGTSSSAWFGANKAAIYPFELTDFAIAVQLFWWVGATSSGNIDIGIYDNELNLIVSAGATAMSATVNTIQKINITDTPLHPGRYLLAAVADNTTGTVFLNTQNDELGMASYAMYDQVTAYPLPNPLVPVVLSEATMRMVAVGIQFAPVM